MADEPLMTATEETLAGAPTDERSGRLAKRQALIDAGGNPYPEHCAVTAHVDELRDRYAALEDGADTQDVYTVAGRIRAKRGQGKAAFIELQDATGTIQLFCRINVLGEEGFAALKQLDTGDIVEATGALVRTRRGELSVVPTEVRLLSKSVRPLPEKFHGLSDKETRYRQRYVDLIVNDDVRDTFTKRFKIDLGLPSLHGGRRILRGRDPHPADDSGRRHGQALHHPLQRPRPGVLSAHRHGAPPQAPAGRRL